MASISQYISLSDGVSGPLRKMAQAADVTVNRMQRLTNVSSASEARLARLGNSGYTALATVRNAAANAVSSVAQIIPVAENSGNAFTYMGNKARGALNGIKASAAGLVSMFGSMFAIGSVMSLVQRSMAAAAELGGAELRLKTIMQQRMGATDDMVNSIKNLIGEEQKVGVVSRAAQTAGAQQLATFLNSKDALGTLIPAMNNLAVQQRGTKATGEDMVNIANMMGRALQGNVGALTRCGITFSDAQADILKYGTEEERAATMAEVITQNVGKMNAVFGQTKGGQAAQKLNQINEVMARIGKSVADAFNSMKIASAGIQVVGVEILGFAVIRVMQIITIFASVVTAVFDAVKPFFEGIPEFIANNWSFIEPVLFGVAAALGVYAAASFFAANGAFAHFAGMVAQTGATIANTLASWGNVAAKIAATYAQYGLNAAIAACPITWIIGAIIALIVIFYLAVAAVNRFAGTSISATGIIFAAFAWLGTGIINTIKTVANVFIAFANFLGSVFQDPLGAVENLFADIWNAVAQYVAEAVNSIIDMINKIPGMSKIHTFSHVSAPTIARKEISGAAFYIKPFELGSRADNAAAAYEAGANLPETLKDTLGGLTEGAKVPTAADIAKQIPSAGDVGGAGGADGGGGGAGKARDAVAKNTKRAADNTDRMVDKLDMTDQEIKELWDTMTPQSIRQWDNENTITIQINNQNTISNDADIDGMTSNLVQGLQEMLSVKRNGVSIPEMT